MDLSSLTAPVTIQVSPGQYNETLTIYKTLTLRRNVGTEGDGADATAPDIFGTQAGSNVIPVTGIGQFSYPTGVAGQFITPYGVAADSSGNVYVADSGKFTRMMS